MNRRVFILGVCCLHLLRALCLLYSAAPMGVTSLNAIGWLFGGRFLCAGALLAGVALALWGEFRADKSHRLNALWFLPQLILVTAAAIGAAVCIWNGHYADHEPRPVEFILADQIIYPIVFLWYCRTINRP